MVIISPRVLKFLAWFRGHSKIAIAITVFPFIIVRSKDDLLPWLITHEQIHLRQQLELLFIGALFLYIAETAYARFVLRLSGYDNYLYFSLEQEAYRNQHNPDYLKNRKPYAVFYYVLHKKTFSHKDGTVTYLK
jgi:hypothetical protein